VKHAKFKKQKKHKLELMIWNGGAKLRFKKKQLNKERALFSDFKCQPASIRELHKKIVHNTHVAETNENVSGNGRNHKAESLNGL
jgi:hypothetical protein